MGCLYKLKKKKKESFGRERNMDITFACLGETKSNKIEGGKKNDKNRQKVTAS